MTPQPPPSRAFTALLCATAGAYAADQLALAAIPLAAVLLLGASSREVGLLVAMHSVAWLVISMPAGILVDQFGRRRMAGLTQALAAGALAFATIAAMQGWAAGLGAAVFVAAGGSVTFMLAAIAVIPSLVASTQFARANASIELVRGGVTIAAPLIAGALAARNMPHAALALAGGGALCAVFALRWIPSDPPVHAATSREPMLVAMRAGAAFVRAEPLLRAIAMCAICWNFAYFALVAIFVPFALERIGLNAGTVGLVQSSFGIGSIAAALLAAPLFARIEPRVFLVVGPASSVLATSLLMISAHAGGAVLPALTYLLLGFAPMLWFICQTTLRQTITPRALLGRVSATIQVAIYGVRPLGALAGGALADLAGFDAALMLVLAAFTASALVAWLSPLSRLRAMPDAV